MAMIVLQIKAIQVYFEIFTKNGHYGWYRKSLEMILTISRRQFVEISTENGCIFPMEVKFTSSTRVCGSL